MSSTTNKPLKGILKKPKADDPSLGRSRTSAREIAVQHANIIQDQRNHESNVLNSIVRLTELPLVRAEPYSSANPSPTDVAEFKSLIRAFQPTEYDDLVAERNVEGLCGYALCSKPRRQFAGAGTWKLVNAGRKDFDIARKEDLEKWCSQGCAKRALYIKVQLLETAAWERVGIPDIQIDLYEEKPVEVGEASQITRQLGQLKLEDDRRQAKEDAALSLERGDVGEKAKRTPIDVEILENSDTAVPVEPTLRDASGDMHLFLEGHRTKFGNQPSARQGGLEEATSKT